MRTWTRATAGAVAVTALAALAAGCATSSSSSGSGVSTIASLTSAMPTSYGPAEEKTLNVGIVPAMDSAGFFVALHNGLFAKEGLTIKYQPAVSSEAAINSQLSGTLDLTAGNYVSYVTAAEQGDPLEVVAEGSVMQAGAQTIFVRPGSKIKTLADLEGATVATNAPQNVDYLLAASVLQENNIKPASVKWTNYDIAFPTMAQSLNAGKWDAMVVPEPFASIAEQKYGEVPLADLNQGATEDFPVEGYVVTKPWAKANPNTLKRFLAALEVGQEISDIDRGAVETAFETIAGGAPNGDVPPQIGAVMALDTYPIGVDKVRLQRVADVMNQFGLLTAPYNVSGMLMPASAFNFSQFSS